MSIPDWRAFLKRPPCRLCLLFVLFFGTGLTVGYYIQSFASGGAGSCQYALLSPYICRGEPVISHRKKELGELKGELTRFIDAQKHMGTVSEVAIYLRDLDNGPVLFIDPEYRFTPASLLKLPVALAYFKRAESNGRLLEREIEAKDESIFDDAQQNIAPQKTIQAGTRYKVKDLIYRSLVYSDNRAKDLLVSYFTQFDSGTDLAIEALEHAGIVNPLDPGSYTITVKDYAALFRMIYEGAYLTPEYSEELLEILSSSDFRKGISRGVPDDIRVAHKFGERSFGVEEVQLHDCGIVYAESPYTLCVMTRGARIEALAGVIAAVSEMVYHEVGKIHSHDKHPHE
jgi:beta-lactamase class A